MFHHLFAARLPLFCGHKGSSQKELQLSSAALHPFFFNYLLSMEKNFMSNTLFNLSAYFFKIHFASQLFFFIFAPQIKTVVVAQLVRASDCDSEGRGFEPPRLPTKNLSNIERFFDNKIILEITLFKQFQFVFWSAFIFPFKIFNVFFVSRYLFYGI